MSTALDMQRERARVLARELVERAPSGAITSIFAGGSLGRGEVWAARVDGTIEVYSDIDLYVVVRDALFVDAIRAQSASPAASAGEDPVCFLRPADVGVYTRADLDAQPLRPGMADLATHHVMLYGDESIPRALAVRDTAKIPAEEALYLLENRALELWGGWAAGDARAARLALAQALKARLDVYSAHAILAGTFASTLAVRAQRFRENPPPTLSGAARDDVARAFDAAGDVGAWVRSRDAETERLGALEAVVTAWETLARPMAPGASPAGLVAWRCRAAAPLDNTRDVWRMRRRTRQSPLRAALAALRLSRLAPRAALRIHALARVLAERTGDAHAFAAHDAYVDRLTRAFGFTAGDLDARVRAMHSAVS